ncbi:MAG: hypothetical protein HXS48_28285 [Theionarchaea archaeon]|nr:hypothetical protein [Theionarchaea archaeon]
MIAELITPGSGGFEVQGGTCYGGFMPYASCRWGAAPIAGWCERGIIPTP